jgi:hypothetical protein
MTVYQREKIYSQTFMDRQAPTEKQLTANPVLAKVAVQCSADTFVVNQIWFSASIPSHRDGENHHLRQARKRGRSL